MYYSITQNGREFFKSKCEELLQEEEFSKERKKSQKLMDVIGGIYWPIATVIYLGWSFWTMDWGITWIVWPIAGILFGVIASICNIVQKNVSE